MKNRRIAAALISAVGLLSVAACSGGSSGDKTENTSASTAVLTVASSASVTTWDPVASFSTEAMYLGNLYEPLLWKNPAGSDEDYTPALATGWTTSDDGLTWTFDIREGVTFHTGEALDAAAVQKSLEAAKERGGASFIWAPVETIKATSDTEVVIELAYAAPVDLIVSSTYGAWIVAPSALDAAAEGREVLRVRGRRRHRPLHRSTPTPRGRRSSSRSTRTTGTPKRLRPTRPWTSRSPPTRSPPSRC